MDASAKTAVPVLALVLRAKDRRGAVVTAFNQLEKEMLFKLCQIIQQPFIKDEQPVSAELLQKLGSAGFRQRCFAEQLHQVGYANIP